MLGLRGVRLGDDAARQREHARADPQAGAIGRAHIDFELQLVCFEQKIDRAALSQKIRSFPDSQYARSLNSFEDSPVTLFLGPANEKNLASAQVLFLVRPSNFDAPARDRSGSRCLGERSSERKVTDYAKEEGRLPGREGARGPIDKIRKGGQEIGFCAIFVGGRDLSGGRKHKQQKGDERHNERAGSCLSRLRSGATPTMQAQTAASENSVGRAA
jgi:hypothetical protein